MGANTFTKQTEKQQMIASLVREKRTLLNYTQQELADLCKVSLRSIQRIENGEVFPRQYTLKELAKHLQFSLDLLKTENNSSTFEPQQTLIRKRIISIASVIGVFLLSAAYIAQSDQFPETNFELFIYYAILLTLLSIGLLFLWRRKS